MTRLPTWPLLMWSLSAGGMALGLAIDCRLVTPAALASLCSAGTNSLLGGFARHLALLPATNIGMLMGGLAAIALGGTTHAASSRPGINLACASAMVIGMSLAGCVGPALASWLGIAWNAWVMIAAMTAGMTLAMVAVTALGRLTAPTTQEFRYRRWPAAESR